jgi:hypothetical protein
LEGFTNVANNTIEPHPEPDSGIVLKVGCAGTGYTVTPTIFEVADTQPLAEVIVAVKLDVWLKAVTFANVPLIVELDPLAAMPCKLPEETLPLVLDHA